MKEVHQFMPITKTIFDDFVANLVATIMAEIGADVPSLTQDLAPVAALLSSPAITVMCNQPGCPNPAGYMAKVCPTAVPQDTAAPGSTGASTGASSGATNATATNAEKTATTTISGAALNTLSAALVAGVVAARLV